MNYEDTIKTIKEEHKKFTEAGKQYRALKKSTKDYMERALEAACKEGTIIEHRTLCRKTFRVFSTNNTGATYLIYSDDEGVVCYPYVPGKGGRHIDLPHGHLEAVLTRLRKKNEVALEDGLRRLYKFLKEYSE